MNANGFTAKLPPLTKEALKELSECMINGNFMLRLKEAKLSSKLSQDGVSVSVVSYGTPSARLYGEIWLTNDEARGILTAYREQQLAQWAEGQTSSFDA